MQPTQPQPASSQPNSQASSSPPKHWWNQISEDWWSVIIGMALVVLVSTGIITSVPW